MRIAVSGGRLEARAAGPPRERGAEGITGPSVRLVVPESQPPTEQLPAGLLPGRHGGSAGGASSSLIWLRVRGRWSSARLGSSGQLLPAPGRGWRIDSPWHLAAPSSVQSAGRPRRGRAGAASFSRMRLKATRPRPASHASPRPSGAMCTPHVGRREGGGEGGADIGS